MNRWLLTAQLTERSATRYTPAGLPALDIGLKHESEVSEDGQARKVTFECRAVAIGAITQRVMQLGLGSSAQFGGFVSSARNGRGMLFHVTALD